MVKPVVGSTGWGVVLNAHLDTMGINAQDYGTVGNGVADDTTAIQNGLNAAVAANTFLYIPAGSYKITGTVLSDTPTNRCTFIRGAGPGTVLLDYNSTGPMLKVNNSNVNNGQKVILEDFTVRLCVNKLAYDCIYLYQLSNSRFIIQRLKFDGQVNAYYCHSAIYLQDIWDGAIRDIDLILWQGIGLYFTCPALNSGNIEITSLFCGYSCCGIYADGDFTNNNFQINNFKGESDGNLFYKTLTTGIPAVAATSITLPTGLASQYFTTGKPLLLHSAAGTEWVHANSYTSGTGVLTLLDSVTKNHAAKADLRVICSQFGIVTRFLVPLLTVVSSHFEQTTNVIIDAPGSQFINCIFSLAFQNVHNNGTIVPISNFVAGENNCDLTFRSSVFMQPSIATFPNNTMVLAMVPANGNGGIPTVRVDGVSTYPPNQADQSTTAMKILDGDSMFTSYGDFDVWSGLHRGPQLTSVPLRAGNQSQNGNSTNSSARIFGGSGVPNSGWGANGDFYLRTDGAAGASLYVRRSGAWVAATGV